jgi:hypothetical protein
MATKKFELTAAQKTQISKMSPDAAERQIAIWKKQWEDAQKAGSPPTTPPPPRPPAPAPAPASAVAPEYANWEEAAKELYGGYYAIVSSVPELRGLLERAYKEKWSDSKFDYELRQTSWWKTNSGSAREWDLGSQVDPASAQQRIEQRVAELRNMALSQFQVNISDVVLRKLATDSLRFGWSQQLVMNAIGIEAVRSPGGMGQLAQGFLGQGLKNTANEYGVTLSEPVLTKWLTEIATGQQTKETYQTYILETAKKLFPSISGQLDTGQTFQQIIDPYRNVASQILEINPETINFLDPKWTKAISLPEQNGQQRSMTFSEWGDYLRQERSFGYEYTSQAQQRAYAVANDLANLFGKA